MANQIISKLYQAVLRKPAFAFGVALCTMGMGLSGGAQKIIPFDAPGADLTPGDYNGTYAAGINGWGAVTGSYQDANSTYHGFLRSPKGEFTTFEAPGADTGSFNGTIPNAINDLGVITGEYFDANGFGHGFLRSPEGKFTTFDVPGVGGYGTTPIAINLEGAVVGYYTDSNFVFYAFLRTPGGNFKTFAGPGACNTGTSTGCYGNEATAISPFGIIVGNYMDSNFIGHGLIRSPNGAVTSFDAPGAGTVPGNYQGTGCPGCSSGFNVWGFIAATYADANNVHHGYVRDPNGKFTTFDAPGAGTGSGQGTGCPSDCPTSLNDLGAITGNYIDAGNVLHGYLRSPQGKFATIDPSGSVFTWSSGINDFESITGYYLDANNVYHGFLRKP